MEKTSAIRLAWCAGFVAVPFVILLLLWPQGSVIDASLLKREEVLQFCQALFSGWAFLGLIMTLIYQRQELTMQRKELRLQRREQRLNRKESERQGETLVQQDAALQRQAQAMTKQVFDSGFYQLLSAFTQARNNTEITNGVTTLRGQNAYREIWQLMRLALGDEDGLQVEFLNCPLVHYFESEQNAQWSTTTSGKLSREETLSIRFSALAYAVTNNAVSIHQRILMSLLEMIRDSSFPPTDRAMYYQIVVAVMSREEIIISAYYTLSFGRGDEYTVLLGESGILDLLQTEPLAKPGDFELIRDRARPDATSNA
jgi:hypothetical protein